jgi:hypothetical protein
MARIARCGVAFPYAGVANDIFGESPVVFRIDKYVFYVIITSTYVYQCLTLYHTITILDAAITREEPKLFTLV